MEVPSSHLAKSGIPSISTSLPEGPPPSTCHPSPHSLDHSVSPQPKAPPTKHSRLLPAGGTPMRSTALHSQQGSSRPRKSPRSASHMCHPASVTDGCWHVRLTPTYHTQRPLQAEDATHWVLEIAPLTAHSMALETEASRCSKASCVSPYVSGAPFPCQVLETSEAAAQEGPYFQGHLGRALGPSRLPEPLARKEHGTEGEEVRVEEGGGSESSGSTLHPSPVPGVDVHSHIPTFHSLSLPLPSLLAINPLPAVG